MFRTITLPPTIIMSANEFIIGGKKRKGKRKMKPTPAKKKKKVIRIKGFPA